MMGFVDFLGGSPIPSGSRSGWLAVDAKVDY